jgi:hypothetical protein
MDDEEEEPIEYAYEGERAEGKSVELSVSVEVEDEKTRTKVETVKLLGPRQGAGKATYPSGDTYAGVYAAGLREGQGVYVYTSKKWRYEGAFKAGKRHGLGTMHYGKKGERYIGGWKDGSKSGQGTMYFANKDIYTGEWLGARHAAKVHRAPAAPRPPSYTSQPLARTRLRGAAASAVRPPPRPLMPPPRSRASHPLPRASLSAFLLLIPTPILLLLLLLLLPPHRRAEGKKHGAGVYYFHETGGELDGHWESGSCVSGAWVDKSGLKYTGRYENQLPASDGEYAFASGVKVRGYYQQAKLKDGSTELRWVQQDVIFPEVAAA